MLNLTGELLATYPGMTEEQSNELEGVKAARRRFQDLIRRFNSCLLMSQHARAETLRVANDPNRPTNICRSIEHLNDWSDIARRDAALTLSDLRLALTWLTSAVGQSEYVRSIVDMKAWKAAVRGADAFIPTNDRIRNAHAHHASHHKNAEDHAADGTFISGNLGGISYDTIDGEYFTFDFSETAINPFIALDSELTNCLQSLHAFAEERIKEHVMGR